MTPETTYTIGQLASLAGVTCRTIRYYSAEGLLPPPDTRGRYARYSGKHLRRLELISRLKNAFLPLSAIKASLEPLTDAQIAALLEAEPPAAGDVQAWTARSLRASSESSAPDGEMDALQRLLAPRDLDFSENLPALPAPRGRILLVSPQLIPSDDEEFPEEWPAVSLEVLPRLEETSAQTWLRIPLAAGVELHVRVPESPEDCAALDRLIAEAKALFRSLR